MRAVLLGTGYYPEMDPLLRHRPTPLLHLADKPILYYIFEFLARQGVTTCDLVLHHLPELIEAKVREGKRWGLSVTYHLAKEGRHPFCPLRPVVQGWSEGPVILGVADSLPEFGHEPFAVKENGIPTLMLYPNKEWSQWGIIPSQILGNIPRGMTIQELPAYLKSYRTVQVRPSLSAQTLEELKKTNQRLIEHKPEEYIFPNTARMIEPEVWISRAVSLHPTAKIIPPVFLGEECQIKGGAQIGPYAIVENRCIIDRGSVIHHTLVCRRSYVGEGLEIHNSIVDRNLLINLRLDTNISVHDDFILSELTVPSFSKYFEAFLEKLLALFFFVVTFPVFLILLCSNHIRRDKMLLLPAASATHDWEMFDWLSFESRKKKNDTPFHRFFKRIPALLNIIKGEVHFVGVSPRSLKDVHKLPLDWQKLYLNSKVGLITLSDLDNGPAALGDDLYASEVYYSTHMGFWYDLKLLGRWMKRKLKFY